MTQPEIVHPESAGRQHLLRGAGGRSDPADDPGRPADAGVFADVSRQLADCYTVVAYDPRGNSRSTFDGEPKDAGSRCSR